eukprot:Opistho-1_new@28742
MTIFKNYFKDNSASMLMIDSETGDINDANDSACQFYGYNHRQLCAMNISDLNTLPRVEVLKQVHAFGKKYINQAEFKHRLSNGSIKDIRVHTSTIEIRKRKKKYCIYRRHKRGKEKRI